MFSREYRTNRARFPHEELAKYRGQWVAFSEDGARIVCHGDSLDMLEDRLQAGGFDPQRVVLEGVPGPDEDTFLGAEELS